MGFSSTGREYAPVANHAVRLPGSRPPIPGPGSRFPTAGSQLVGSVWVGLVRFGLVGSLTF
eukprot:11169207-Lingulodinium_polyedra.AAC.1